MGQKVNPNSFRMQITDDWKSRWFSDKSTYKTLLAQDIKLRKYAKSKLGRGAGVARIEIERFSGNTSINIYSSKPGVVIGRGGAGVEELRKELEKMAGGPIKVNILEVPKPELVALLQAENIATQIEKRISYRRAIKQAIDSASRAGAKGIKIQASGRLGGAEMSRREVQQYGKLPLQTLRSDIDFAFVNAFTTFGTIGIKVWVYRGELKNQEQREEEEHNKRFKQVFGLENK